MNRDAVEAAELYLRTAAKPDPADYNGRPEGENLKWPRAGAEQRYVGGGDMRRPS